MTFDESLLPRLDYSIVFDIYGVVEDFSNQHTICFL